eukprot:7388102-Prymnesium_polylepis.1
MTRLATWRRRSCRPQGAQKWPNLQAAHSRPSSSGGHSQPGEQSRTGAGAAERRASRRGRREVGREAAACVRAGAIQITRANQAVKGSATRKAYGEYSRQTDYLWVTLWAHTLACLVCVVCVACARCVFAHVWYGGGGEGKGGEGEGGKDGEGGGDGGGDGGNGGCNGGGHGFRLITVAVTYGYQTSSASAGGAAAE